MTEHGDLNLSQEYLFSTLIEGGKREAFSKYGYWWDSINILGMWYIHHELVYVGMHVHVYCSYGLGSFYLVIGVFTNDLISGW